MVQPHRPNDTRLLTAAMAIAVFLAGQTGAAIWWASRISTRQEYVIEELRAMKLQVARQMDDRYRAEDARRDFLARDAHLGKLDDRVAALERGKN